MNIPTYPLYYLLSEKNVIIFDSLIESMLIFNVKEYIISALNIV